MKNIKINEALRTRIISGGLCLVLAASGFGLGKLDSKNNSSESSNTTIVSDDELVSVSSDDLVNQYLSDYIEKREALEKQYLSDYIEKREALEKEITSLLLQKERLQKVRTFDMKDLVVMESSNVSGEPNLYIVYTIVDGDDKCYEYHKNFKAWYRPHPYTSEHYDICSGYVHFNEGQPLFNYLTDQEIETLTINGGKVTTLELDQILVRIRSEYQEQISENNHSRNLTNN